MALVIYIVYSENKLNITGKWKESQYRTQAEWGMPEAGRGFLEEI